MNSISLSINVTVDFSESTKAFIQRLLSNFVSTVDAAKVETKSTVDAAKVETKSTVDAAKVETKSTVDAAKVETKSTVDAAKVETKSTVDASKSAQQNITIDDVRKALSLKVNAHRAEIKDKLNEFGAPSVTKLDTSKYKEMYDFLNAL